MNRELLSLLNDLLGDYTKFNKTDVAFKCPNPTCKSKYSDRRNKLIVRLDKFMYHCWVCGLKGADLKKLIKVVGRNYNDFADRIKRANEHFVWDTTTTNQTSIITLPQEAYPIYSKNTYMTKEALDYLYSRGLRKIDIVRYNIHFAEFGKYKDRIIIPSYNKTGTLNMFAARTIHKKYTSDIYTGPRVNKTIGFEMFINWNLPVILIEGYIDAIIVRHNAIPLGGKYISKQLLSKLQIYRPKIYVCLDGDARTETNKLLSVLFKRGLDVYDIKLPENEDPANLGYDKFWEYANNAQQINLEYFLQISES